MKRIIFLLLLLTSRFIATAGSSDPAVFSTAKPWAYWWWPGSAVTEKGITHNLENFAKAGFGGLHIIPIYGAKGSEALFQNYLSPGWQAKFFFTLKEAKRLGLGIDMTMGTGWPLGGPTITEKEAAKKYQFVDGVFTTGLTGQKVKRAAPGGEGFVLDHFDMKAFAKYCHTFVPLLKKSHSPLRAIYNDSYEAYGSNYTPDLFPAFQRLNGYDLRKHFDVLAKKKAESEEENQIFADYHRTMSTLLQNNFVLPFDHWINSMGFTSRNQAHGSPGNLLDIYAAADIPEAEFFGSKPFDIPGYRVDPEYDSTTFGIPDIRALKLASSAANLTGKKLVSAETATWLGNHFKVSIAQVKPVLDQVFVGGVNHVFFHGATYSPPDVTWPGWLFYASTNFNPQSHFWEAMPALNKYIENVQTMLQANPTDSDALLYFPMEDVWHNNNGSGKLHTLELHANSREWLKNTSFGHWAGLLQDKGFSVDYISDELLSDLELTPSKTFKTRAGGNYKVLLIPAAHYISVETLERLAKWVKQGYPVYFLEHLPLHLNTFHQTKEAKERWEAARSALFMRVLSDPADQLARLGVSTEPMAAKGLSFIRKKTPKGAAYFVTNLNARFTEGNISLKKLSGNVEIWDPLTDSKSYGKKGSDVWLSLAPGQSVIIQPVAKIPSLIVPAALKVRTEIEPTNLRVQIDSKTIALPDFNYYTSLDTSLAATPSARYTFDLTLSADQIANAKVLHLSELRDMAKVRINGKDIGMIWSLPFQLTIPDGILQEQNQVEIEVISNAANRIRKMDQQGVVWKNFYEINFVDIRYKPFDASKWAIEDGGMKGKLYFTNR
ncbi:glycosyl hydrolase [Aquirufa antheringensis]